MPLIDSAYRDMNRERRLAILKQLQAINYENPPAVFLLEQISLIGDRPNIRRLTRRSRAVAYDRLERDP